MNLSPALARSLLRSVRRALHNRAPEQPLCAHHLTIFHRLSDNDRYPHLSIEDVDRVSLEYSRQCRACLDLQEAPDG